MPWIVSSGMAWTPMKKIATPQRQSVNICPPDHITGPAMDNSGAAGAGNDQDPAELAWKHSREQITEALQETPQALAPEKDRSATGKS